MGFRQHEVQVFVGIMLVVAAVPATDQSPCLDCGVAGDDEVAFLQMQGVMTHGSGETHSNQIDHMDRPPKFVLALAAKEAASKKTAGGAESMAVQYVAAFAPYFNYQGDLKVQGSIAVEGTGLIETATQTLSWQLEGLDPRCNESNEGVSNACGIHIHQGTSCYEDAGGHYWNTTLIDSDPWATVTYQTRKNESAWAVGVEVVTGLTNFEVLGRAMIVHDFTGARIACGIIIPEKLAVPAFTPYFSYTGSLEVEGAMDVTGMGVTDDAGQILSWSLKGLDPNCSSGANSEYSNSCGIHIHAGTDCTSDALGHYWNQTTYSADDPWSMISYTSKKGKSREKQVPVVTGLENTFVNGHAMIVHSYIGGRIACGIISPSSEVANAFVKYYTYTGDLEVSGWVKVVGTGVLEDASQELSWRLAGVDPACETAPGTGANANACGIHIHVGMDCTSDAGGHYYAVDTDPWTALKYTTTPRGHAKAKEQKVDTGLTNYDVLGHTMIVHDSTGARIACGILNIASD